MDNIFTYVPIILGIINDVHSHFKTRNTITDNNIKNIHTRLLSKLYDNNIPCALIYENELSLTRNIADVNNNEIKNFVSTNVDWDILYIGNISEPSTAIDGYSFIEKLSTTQYDNHVVYLASSRLMEKAKNNNLTTLNVYKYNSPFITNLILPVQSNRYTIGRVNHIFKLQANTIKYSWVEYPI